MNRHNFLLVVAVCLMASVGLVSALNTYISNGYSVFNGSVGIGTNNLSGALVIAGNINVRNNGTIHWNGGLAGWDAGGNLELGGSGIGNPHPYIDFKTNESEDYDMRIQLINDSNMGVYGGNFIIPGGNLSIGTTSLSAKLSLRAHCGSSSGKHLMADFGVYGSSANTHIFFYGDGNDNSGNWIGTSGNEKLILGDGNNPNTLSITGGRVGIGTDNPGRRLDVRDTSSSYVIKVVDSSNTCDFGVDGSGWVSSCSSDNRLKTDIKDTGDVLNWLMNFRIRDYIWKSNGERGTGVIAQEVQKFAPEMVQIGEDGYLRVSGVNEWKLVKAIQELAMENYQLRQDNLEMKKGLEKLRLENIQIKETLCKLGEKKWC